MSTRTDECYRLLKDRILDGTYPPDSRLVIDRLRVELHVSSIPLRESMRRLEAEGWLEIVPNAGARVIRFDSNAWSQTVGLLARLEGLATALAAPRLSIGELQAARQTNREMAQVLVDFDPVQFTRLNREFHMSICRRAEDAHLNLLLELEWSRLDVTRRSVFALAPSRARSSVVEHDALLDLVAAGADPGVIESTARRHKLNTLAAVVAQDEAAIG